MSASLFWFLERLQGWIKNSWLWLWSELSCVSHYIFFFSVLGRVPECCRGNRLHLCFGWRATCLNGPARRYHNVRLRWLPPSFCGLSKTHTMKHIVWGPSKGDPGSPHITPPMYQYLHNYRQVQRWVVKCLFGFSSHTTYHSTSWSAYPDNSRAWTNWSSTTHTRDEVDTRMQTQQTFLL